MPVRQIVNQRGARVLLADTVGFVSELPPELIAAFRATLLETREADLLLHVIDASDPFHAERREQVDQVLESIGAGGIPAIRVYNKIDRSGQRADLQRDEYGRIKRVFLSARYGQGLDELKQAIQQRLAGERVRCWIQLEGKDARLRAQLFEMGAVREEKIADHGAWVLFIDLPRAHVERLAGQPGVLGAMFRDQILSGDALCRTA